MDFTIEQAPVGQTDLAPQSDLKAGVAGEVTNPDFSLPPLQARDASGAINSLTRVAVKILAPVIQRSEESAFMEGMARAAAGAAAQDIEAERPAWAGIFGEGAATAGARAYEGLADGAAFEGWAAASMKEARKLPPLEYAKMLQEQFARMRTADPIRAQQLQGMILKATPQLMKHHAKEHVAYNQEVAWKARGTAISEQFRAYEAWAKQFRADPSKFNDGDAERVKGGLLQALQPFPGEDLEMRDKQLTSIVEGETARGNFEAVNFLKQSGAWAGIELQNRDRIEAAYRSNGLREIFGRVTPEIVQRVAALENNPELTGEQIDAEIAAINTAAIAATGIDVELIPDKDRLRLRLQGERLREAAVSRAATASKKAADAAAEERAAEEQRLRINGAVGVAIRSEAQVPGAAWVLTQHMGKNADDITEMALDDEYLRAFKSSPDNMAKVVVAATGSEGRKLKPFQMLVDTMATSPEHSAANESAMQALARLPAMVRNRYLDANLTGPMFEEWAAAGAVPDRTPEERWRLARLNVEKRALAKRGPLSKIEEKAADGAIGRMMDKGRFFGENRMVHGEDLLRLLVRSNWSKAYGETLDEKADAALAMARDQGLADAGGIPFLLSDRDRQLNWRARFGVNDRPPPPGELNAAFQAEMARVTANATEAKPAQFLMLRTGADGQLVWEGTYTDIVDGMATQRLFQFTEAGVRKQLEAAAATRRDKATKPKASGEVALDYTRVFPN